MTESRISYQLMAMIEFMVPIVDIYNIDEDLADLTRKVGVNLACTSRYAVALHVHKSDLRGGRNSSQINTIACFFTLLGYYENRM